MEQNGATSTKDSPVGRYANESVLWRERYQVAASNQRQMFKRFADWYDDFYAVVQRKQYNLWRAKVYIPVLASKAWNMIGKFIALKPGFEVRPRLDGVSFEDLGSSEQLEEAAYKNQLKLEYDYDNPNLTRPIRESLLSVLVDSVVTGTGIAKVPWDTVQKTRYEHVIRGDGTIDMTKEKVIKSRECYNNLIPVNIFNVFMAPTSVDLYNAPWIIIKDFKTWTQLNDVNQAKGVEVYKNLDSIKNARSAGDEFATYKKSRNRLTTQTDPIAADMTVDFFPIYECYDRSTNEILTFAEAGADEGGKSDNWVEIRRQNNIYWHGKYPLVRFMVKQRPYDVWGQGIFETTQRVQRAINDVFNHFLDNWNLSVDGMLIAREDAGVNDYIVEPGGTITYRTEEPKQFKFPEPNPASLQMIMGQFMQAVENDTISNYGTGSPDSELDKTRGTKGGIEAIQDAADDMTSFMRMNFQESIKMVGSMWLSNNQQFMSKPLTVVVKHRNHNYPTSINPQDIQGGMQLRVDDASMMPISDDQKKAQYMQFQQQAMGLQQASFAQHQAFGTDPLVLNFGAMLEEAAEKSGFRNVNALIQKLPPGPTPLQMQQSMELHTNAAKAAQGGPQSVQDKMQELMNYKDAPDDIKRQMEQQAGFRPSQLQTNSQNPTTMQANRATLQTAHELHAKGLLHPAVLDAVRAHMGLHPLMAPPAAPIGQPPLPPEPVGATQ